jgi:D-sedoheptulose 7-phosphate isomerase
MASKPIATEYLSKFQDLIGRTEVTDKRGKKLSFDAGVSEAIAIVRGVKSGRRKIMFVGNGGSAGIVSHLAVDFWKMGGMRSMVFSDPAFLTCIANDDGYPHVYEKPIETFVDSGDCLMAISSSGQSENILRAAKAAEKGGAKVVTLSGFKPGNPLRSLGDLNFYVPSDTYNYVETLHMLLCTCILDCMQVTKTQAVA